MTRDLDADALTHAQAARRAAGIAQHYAPRSDAAREWAHEAADLAAHAMQHCEAPEPDAGRAWTVATLSRGAIHAAREARRYGVGR